MTDAPKPPDPAIVAIAPEQNTAELVERLLREAGHNLHVEWRADVADLPAQDGATPGLICVHADSDGEALSALVAVCAQQAPQARVIALTDDDDRAALLNHGAADAVDSRDTDLLSQVLIRELYSARRERTLADANHRLAQMEMRLDAILSESQDARATVHEGIHARINPVYAELFGFADAAELEGVPLMDLVVPEDREAVKDALARCARQEDQAPATIAFTGQRADDSRVRLNLHLQRVTADGETQVEIRVEPASPAGGEARYTGGLAGRPSLYRALEGAADGIRGLLYLQVDDIETLQQRLGPARLDQILDDLSAYLLEQMRDGDRCFRFQVDGFAVLVATDDDEQTLLTLAESLRRAVDGEVFGDESGSTALTVSTAVSPLEGERETALLAAARLAHGLSEAGGNRIETVAAAQPATAAERGSEQRWATRLRQALDNNGLGLAYQSIASLEGNRNQLNDALPRLLGDNGRSLPLSEFGPIASSHGLLCEIDRWLTARALNLQQQRSDPAPLLLPLSADTLEAADEFITWLGPKARQAPAATQSMVFAFREADVQGNVKRAESLARQLKTLGARVSLDGYGETSQSAQLLERVPLDFVKLDATLTAAPGGDEEHPRLPELIEAAARQGVPVIAQRVRDANSMARLWQLGVQYIQNRTVREPDDAQPSAGANVA